MTLPPVVATALRAALPMLAGTLRTVPADTLAAQVVDWADAKLLPDERTRLAAVAAALAARLRA